MAERDELLPVTNPSETVLAEAIDTSPLEHVPAGHASWAMVAMVAKNVYDSAVADSADPTGYISRIEIPFEDPDECFRYSSSLWHHDESTRVLEDMVPRRSNDIAKDVIFSAIGRTVTYVVAVRPWDTPPRVVMKNMMIIFEQEIPSL